MNPRPHQDDIEAARKIYEKFVEWKAFDPDNHDGIAQIIASVTGPLREALKNSLPYQPKALRERAEKLLEAKEPR